MKLGKLLGAGKSFFGGQETVTYRENKQVYLPTFNAGRNPFAAKTPEPKPDAAMPEAMAPAVVKPKEAVALPARVPALAPAPTPVRGPVRATNWAEKLNPFRGAKPAKSAPPAAMPNLQPEFPLNAVKVVHNDLSDADVEVVPMKSRSATPAMAMTAPVPMEFLGEPVLKSI
jgi:hypothetical protein